GGAITLTSSNDVVTLAATAASGAIVFRDVPTLTVATVAAGGNAGFTGASGVTTTDSDITLCVDSGSLVIDQAVSAGVAAVRLQAAGDIGAAAPITAGALGVLALGGSIDLDNAANAVAAFAAQTLAGGDIDFRNAGSFATGQVTAAACFAATVTGVVTSGGRVELCADAGTVTVGTSGVVGSGVDAGGVLVLLVASTGAVTQTSAGSIVAASLAVFAAGA